ncbi:2'-5' RNA ligase family protein [Nocardioides sp. Bht2]|uniref:2'-5' RNA ligase family protein n=1 Tax=Nocardioides sp. Bht2 TaxID=3392297 RepID=UPI0039B5B204
MPDHAFELSFDDASERAIVDQWLALKAAGIPSQADHRSMTNAPHLTLAAATPIPATLIEPAVSLIGPLLPTRIQLRGLILLGNGPRVTVAHLVEPTPALAAATLELRALVPGLRHPVWMPHLTLARRVPRRLLPAALEVLAATPTVETLSADRLRWWDPDADVVDDIAIG